MAMVAAWIAARKQLISATKSQRCPVVCIRNNFVVGRHALQYSCAVVRNRALFASQQHQHIQLLRPLWSVASPQALSVISDQKKARSTIVWHPLSSRSYNSNQEPSFPLTTAELEFNVGELERTCQLRQQQQQLQLSKHDLHNRAWHLLSECASISSSNIPNKFDKGVRRSSDKTTTQQELLLRAKLGSRILDICLKEVESRRLFLWEWLSWESNEIDDSAIINTNPSTIDRFSPTAYWNEAPHPTKEMYSLIFSMWKSVIESCSSFSIKSSDAMDLMESCAQQSSSLLSLMEEEYSSDAAFIDAYNSQIQTGRYTLLRMGAVLPDVRNYSEVIRTWGQCIDGSNLRLSSSEKQDKSRQRSYPSSRDGALFHKRLKLEATAMKSMMELLESMEEDLYGTFQSESNNTNSSQQRKRPPPDRHCYNIILAAMARQINPSLYEMRLVLQRMMERVKYELELLDNDPDLTQESDTAQLYELAMSFFPDVYSYNALIEARANRSAMFASDNKPQPQSIGGYTSPRLRYRSAWQQQNNAENLSRRKKRFTASEEEAILAEQIIEEMRHLATVTVRPNIWSYNAVIKSWIKTDSERGLLRAVLIFNALAMHGHDRSNDEDKEPSLGADKFEKGSTVFDRISRWGASLLGSGDSSSDCSDRASDERSKIKPIHAHDSRSNTQSESVPNQASYETRIRGSNQTSQVFQSVGMASRLSYLYSAGGEVKRNDTRAHRVISHGSKATLTSPPTLNKSDDDMQSNAPEPIGPLPYIEDKVAPDLKTFLIVSQALERRGTALSTKLAEDLLHLLEEYYFDLNTDIAIYNSVLNAFAKAAKETSDARSCMAYAQKADDLVCKLMEKDRVESDMAPRPNEYSFLMAINAWSNAATAAVSTGNVSDGRSAALKAEELLKTLQTQPLKTNKSTMACFGAVIRIWASLGDAEQAQRVLENMVEKSERLPLEIIHFNAVLDAWARTLISQSDTDKAISRLLNIRDLLMKMNRGGYDSYNVDPDTSSFNQVIRACYSPWASTLEKDDENIRYKAFAIAYECYTKMIQDNNRSYRPDAHTYAHIFKAISTLLPSSTMENRSEKNDVCKTVLHACCRDGHLSKSSIWTLRKCFPDGDEFIALLLSELDNHGTISTKEKLLMISEDRLLAYLPMEWSRNGRNYKALNRHRQ